MKPFTALLTVLCLLPLTAAVAAPPAAAPSEPAPVTRPSPQKTWLSMTPDERRPLIDAWLQLDDTTRPPFPVFRDGALEKIRKAAPTGHSLTKN